MPALWPTESSHGESISATAWLTSLASTSHQQVFKRSSLVQIKQYFPLLPREALNLWHFDLLNMPVLFWSDVLGYGWRASYVIPAVPGFLIAVLLFISVKEPSKEVQSLSPPLSVGTTGINSSAQSSPDRKSQSSSGSKLDTIVAFRYFSYFNPL